MGIFDRRRSSDENIERLQVDACVDDYPENNDIGDDDTPKDKRSKPRHRRPRKYRRSHKYIPIPHPSSPSTCHSSADDRSAYADDNTSDDDDIAKPDVCSREYGNINFKTKSFNQDDDDTIFEGTIGPSKSNLSTDCAPPEETATCSDNTRKHIRQKSVRNEESFDSLRSDNNGPANSYQQPNHSSSEDSVFEVRAKSARDLVKCQEHLVEMLQAMKTEISRMDREATRIREDVVRSNQLFDITVRMKDPHHLPMSPDGYNMFYSMPKVTYKTHVYGDGPGTMRFLSQLSSFRNGRLSSDSSCRSSVTPAYEAARSLRAEHRRSIRESLPSVAASRDGRSSSLARLNDGNHSGTESDLDSTCSSRVGWSRDSTMTRDSDVTYEGAGSSTESASTYREEGPRDYMNERSTDRRSSYFYTARATTPQQALSDEVEL